MGVIDIEDVVRRWARSIYETINGDSEGITMETEWNKVHFKTANTRFPSVEEVETSMGPRGHVIFKSNYENLTDEVQDYTFLLEKKTDATVLTGVTNGFSKNGTVGINIDVPPAIFNTTGSFGSDILIIDENMNTVEHAVLWRLNSAVRTMPGERTIAEMTITETEYECSFVADVHIRGTVRVNIRKDDSFQTVEGDVATIIKDMLAAGKYRHDGYLGVQEGKATWRVSGDLKFRFGISQNVVIRSEDL